METSSYANDLAFIHGVVALYQIAYIFIVYIGLPVAVCILGWVFYNLTKRVFKR